MQRSFLVLQGTASPFFGRLATALRARGHWVRRVNFCGGDLIYSGSEGSWNYADPVEHLPEWYGDVVRKGDFTDVVMFGDCREIHRPVHPIARAGGLRVHVFEEGYVRPHWLTLERGGVNGRSSLPKDPAIYFAARGEMPSAGVGCPTGYNLYERAFHDIRYRAANAFFRTRFPHYRSHRPKNGLFEYAGLTSRALLQRHYQREAERVTAELLEKRRDFYLFPLQLNSDAQIIVHSPFSGIREAIDRVMQSFAAHAPPDSLLVIKNHPLDTGLIEYRRYTERLADELRVAERVRFIDAGHLPTLLDHAKGVVVVNSTVGLSALHHRRPLIALGDAIYAVPGLTWQRTIDEFWRQGSTPDMDLYQAFLSYILHHTQINGDFYTRTGMQMAVQGAIDRLDRTDA
ncbi:TPA: capsule biosynthesis protein [Burkholderia cenocepacia]|uniref:capsule biosynthesis protein n=1 Tax=Burkholderia cenocepacia TaxID=95486 RepID=UPI00073A7D42|nr:capsular biosynthesis protein [Burkholderia cenocepacia]ALV57701.1 capsular biosynthesis protein [Burkholderia cenocepacia]AQQ48831.1 capsular biosynthesis protein [Burkholderia cenocepacia]MDI9649349.1 capsular biosynthesis protein [Burkholderia cenocepacia]ONI93657.1 capsular biosynthesis protein [Burkholderia cenocepacia]ONJ09920.1 capsular biosynthesis protein [Burkholderia cenocepacia]